MGHVLAGSQELGLYAGRNRRFLGRRAIQFCFLKTISTTWWFRKDRREASGTRNLDQPIEGRRSEKEQVNIKEHLLLVLFLIKTKGHWFSG